MPSESLRPKIREESLTLSGDRIFFTIQGEGPSIGLPAVFLRLHLCNLECSWCDTPYTWNEKLPEFWNEWKQYPVEEVAQQIKQYPCRRLVITGGEPLLQQVSILKLTELLNDWLIEIETNGTIAPTPELLRRCQFNISPKLSNSSMPFEKRIRNQVLQSFLSAENYFFKFVVSEINDLDQVMAIAASIGIAPEKIIIMPEGTDAVILGGRLAEIAEAVRNTGYRLLPRLHVQIWGNRRAV